MVSEKKEIEHCERRTDDDGRTQDHEYPISSPMSLRLRLAKNTNKIGHNPTLFNPCLHSSNDKTGSSPIKQANMVHFKHMRTKNHQHYFNTSSYVFKTRFHRDGGSGYRRTGKPCPFIRRCVAIKIRNHLVSFIECVCNSMCLWHDILYSFVSKRVLERR